jgi:Uma2 family endonuclease
MRTRVLASNRYYYPDYTIVCGKPRFEVLEGVDSLLNPTIIFEILSESTKRLDRAEKWLAYQQLDSLSTYVLVHQDRPLVEVYRRDPATGDWDIVSVDGLESTLSLPAISGEVMLAQLYANVEFPQRGADDSDFHLTEP